jgi:hypothetical protein
MGEPLGNLSYHMSVLKKMGYIVLFEAIPQRGALEHIYKLDPNGLLGSGPLREIPPALQTQVVGSALAGFTERAVEAIDAGTVESRAGSGITWLPLNLDERGWKELRRMLADVEKRFRDVAVRSADRMESPKDVVPVIVATAAFEVAGGREVGPQ